MEHVLIRALEHLTGDSRKPNLGFAVETRDRPGPAHKKGAYPDDVVWVQLRGGLFVAKARIRIGWVGEYSDIREIRARTKGAPIHDVRGFWTGRARLGYSAVAALSAESWIEPFWAGPRTYGYEWVLLEDQKKRSAWLDPKAAPRNGEALERNFNRWKESAAR